MSREAQTESPEGSVNWDAFKAFTSKKVDAVEGAPDAPAGETPTETQEPQFVEVSLKGRKIKMAAEDAAALEDFRREVRERDGRLGGENAQLKERLARVEGMVETIRREPAKPAADLQPPPASLAHENFEEWARQNDRYHAAKRAVERAELEAQYEADKARERQEQIEEAQQKAWAEKFYADYPHLNKPSIRALVSNVATSNLRDVMSHEGTKAQHERLAELAEAALVEIKGVGKETPTPKPPRLEGGSTPAPARKSAAEGTRREPVTAASWVAKKRAAMRGGK